MIEAIKQGGILEGVFVGLGGVAANVLGLDKLSQATDRLSEIDREVLAIQSRLGGNQKRTDKGIVGLTPDDIQASINQLKKLGLEKANLERVVNPEPSANPRPATDTPFTPSASGTGKSKAEQEAEAAKRAADSFVEKLKEQAQQLGFTKEQTILFEASQLKLNAAQRASVNQSIEQIAAFERLQAAQDAATDFEKASQAGDDNALRDLEEFSRLEQEQLAARQSNFEEYSERIARENEELNVKLIQNDKERAKAQLALELERSIARIEAMQLEAEQAQMLIDDETALYERKLEEVGKSSRNTQDVARDLGLTFETAFENAIVRGEKFSDVLAGIGQDLLRLVVRKNVTEPLFEAIGGFDLGSIFSNSGVIFNANGNVYSGAGISAYSGQVVSSPTVFPFAKGIGLMGEAGPEAIMPLTRIGGKLGVRAERGGTNVEVNIIGAPGNPTVNTREDDSGNLTVDVMFEQVEGFIAKRTARGEGAFAGVLEGRYGLSPGYGARG